eukprot:TRINITY_DN1814_c0_g1_i1.p1 TRINITY_DN1814_c0_g1~~TRINITY_DN1814_c0_g1_i1.p1  ORF type:complete len:110 (-),score=1.37 TRINITY_DN1814_c0_g1_i1:450-779(-)
MLRIQCSDRYDLLSFCVSRAGVAIRSFEDAAAAVWSNSEMFRCPLYVVGTRMFNVIMSCTPNSENAALVRSQPELNLYELYCASAGCFRVAMIAVAAVDDRAVKGQALQ